MLFNRFCKIFIALLWCGAWHSVNAQEPKQQPKPAETETIRLETKLALAIEVPAQILETFDQPNKQWPQTATSYQKQGKYFVSKSVTLPVLPYHYADFEASLNVNFLPSPKRIDITPIPESRDEFFPVTILLFRINEHGYYQLSFSGAPYRHTGKYQLTKVVDGRASELIHWHEDTAIRTDVQIKVKCVGARIEIFANGLRLASIQDNSHAMGQFGLGFSGGSAYFDNLLIKRLP